MQIYDDKKKRIGTLIGYRDRSITKTLDSGDKELSFEYPINGGAVGLLREERYIRTKEDEFVIKAVETGDRYNKYTATLNVEELEGQSFPYGFESQEQTITACLTFAFEGTGWAVGTCTVTKRRTIDIEEATTAWGVLQSCISTYRCECDIDSLKKRINIYERIGRNRGCYFVKGINLRKLTVTSDTYEFYTRIIPIGKDGITIKRLHGKEYLENHQYSKKIKTYTWKDERYTNETSLMEDAEAKLEELSKPYRVFTADIIDLAKVNSKYKSVLDYGIGDTVTMVSRYPKIREKQRIVKIVEYPETPEKNTVELSNTNKTFAEVQKAETEIAKTEAVSIANNNTKEVLQDYSTTEQVETKIAELGNSIEISVKNGKDSSTINLTVGGVEISSGTINLSGLVKFTDLAKSGETEINGSNIKTGTIKDKTGNTEWNLETGALKCKKLSIDSNNFTLNESGILSAKSANLENANITNGSIVQETSTAKLIIESAELSGGYKGEYENAIDFSNRVAGNSALAIIGEYGVQLRTPKLFVASDRNASTVYTGFTGTRGGYDYINGIMIY